MKHPAFPTTQWTLVPDRQGLLPVAAARGGPVDISWEVHGTGPRKMLLVCGLGFLKGSFQRQTKHFGHDRGAEHSVLIVDNRGMGASGKPWRRYSTSEMARDLVEVLDHVGWTAPRQVHVAGISMGGMIAQELACLVPGRLASLALLCTAAAIENTTRFSANMAQRVPMLPTYVSERARWTRIPPSGFDCLRTSRFVARSSSPRASSLVYPRSCVHPAPLLAFLCPHPPLPLS